MCDCHECQRLESECDHTKEVIRAVVRERFNSVREKIFALHEAQEVRTATCGCYTITEGIIQENPGYSSANVLCQAKNLLLLFWFRNKI